ncbi:unnamed protein product [Hermetia illucens]|uniref:Uncharacterized protein n=1 Tax=Hermetia illucens TaxID=343691 RepID=A0A7R8UHK5_HERIL|nr:uncharacterized protein LOC119649432 [Hermetia illucens]XP_037907510.1 uncharacterized protein LOC119649432 [Hermetia illucens]CAD7080738.1 unnamed protein product [Hermetia illucens]
MIQHQIYLVLASIASISNAIRVDWNTNTGPIIPPTSTLPPVPQQPYRQPAPVWESSENDIPNPQPYHYILPPPSRPRPATDNYARASPAELQKMNLQYQSPKSHYGQFVNNLNSIQNGVPTLGVQYIPNKGLKYFALAPSSGKVYYSKDVDGFDKYNKLNGKYNAKLKKHKAYEKVKHVKYNNNVSSKYQQQEQQVSESQLSYSSTQPPQYQQAQYHQQNNYQGLHTQVSYNTQAPSHVQYNTQAPSQNVYYRPKNVWEGYVKSRR